MTTETVIDPERVTHDPNDYVKRYIHQANEGSYRCRNVTFTQGTIYNMGSAHEYVQEMFVRGKLEVGLVVVVDIVGDAEHRRHWSPEKPGGVTVYRIFLI
jgi:hypothetical protein